MKKIKDQHGREIKLSADISILDDYDQVSVFEGGYIITPSGNFIVIEKGQDHGKVLSEYISKYFNCEYINYQSFEAGKILSDNGHFIYYGLGTDSVKIQTAIEDDICNCYNAYKVFLLIPTDLEDVTLDQFYSFNAFLASNISNISKREALDIRLCNFSNNMEYSIDEVLNKLYEKYINEKHPVKQKQILSFALNKY